MSRYEDSAAADSCRGAMVHFVGAIVAALTAKLGIACEKGPSIYGNGNARQSTRKVEQSSGAESVNCGVGNVSTTLYENL